MKAISVSENGPALWDDILRAVGLCWEPIIAGGCIRDYSLGIAPKDIDVVVGGDNFEDFYSIIKQLGSSCVGSFLIEGNPDYQPEEGNCPELIGVWEGTILGCPANIICRRSYRDGDMLECISTFDFGCVQAGYSTERGFVVTQAYTKDINAKTATFLGLGNFPASLARFERWQARGIPLSLVTLTTATKEDADDNIPF